MDIFEQKIKEVIMLFGWDETPKRKPIGKTEWEVIKKASKNKCVICRKTEKSVGKLIKAHIKAHSRGGGGHYVPMCPTCHLKYDHQLLTATQLSKIGLSMAQYKRLVPKKKKKDSGILGW